MQLCFSFSAAKPTNLCGMGGTTQPVNNLLEGLDLAHLSPEDIEPVLAQGQAEVVFLILTLSSRLAELQKSDPVAPPSEKRSRVIEDIPQVQPETVELFIPRCYCPKCRILVEPVIPGAKRVIKRLAKYRHALLTFLDDPGLPFDNNLAEREIRPAVLMRKNSFHNMSQDGATTQAVLMTIYRTLKLRGHDPIETIVSALRHYLSHNFSLPPLPCLNLPSDG
jgi:transposase